MSLINPKAPILVTGASGYVAGWIVKKLLEAGHAVHATAGAPDTGSIAARLLQITHARAATRG